MRDKAMSARLHNKVGRFRPENKPNRKMCWQNMHCIVKEKINFLLIRLDKDNRTPFDNSDSVATDNDFSEISRIILCQDFDL